MSESKIEWTDATWNPTTGCSKVSDGCKFCYAERMAKRLHAMGNPRYANGFEPTMHEAALDLPYTWKKPKKIFVNSMSDLFHKEITLEFIQKVYAVMNDTPHHIYQILTKRPDRAREIAHLLNWSPNIWFGTSVENEKVLNRVQILTEIPAVVRFLSCEPLIGSLDSLELEGIQWVIVGGESGPGARPLEEEWVIDIKNKCERYNVPFFFKQWGGVQKHRNGRLLKQKEYNDFPICNN